MLKLPTLRISRHDAKALIGERIKEGRRANIEFYESSSKPAERRYTTWDRRNYTFLTELFDTDEIAVEYKAIAKFVLTGSYRSAERAEQHKKRIDRKVKWFKELARRIDNHFHEAGEAFPNPQFSETLCALAKVDLLCSPSIRYWTSSINPNEPTNEDDVPLFKTSTVFRKYSTL
jgi:hypothetical protein